MSGKEIENEWDMLLRIEEGNNMLIKKKHIKQMCKLKRNEVKESQ